MEIGTAYDEEGNLASIHICNSCSQVFTVTPPVSEKSFGGDCLAPHCASYDVSRDQDYLFGASR